MSGRITADDVTIAADERYVDGGRRIEAHVKGRNKTYIVDQWGGTWFCTCTVVGARSHDCPHVRATKEAIA